MFGEFEVDISKLPQSVAHIGISLEFNLPQTRPLRIRTFFSRTSYTFESKIRSETELAIEYERLSDALDPFTECFTVAWDKRDDTFTEAHMNALYGRFLATGNSIYNRIFNDDAQAFLTSIIKRVVLSGMKPLIEIDSDVPTFPWEMLVDINPDTLDNKFTPGNLRNSFWGTKYKIYRTISEPGGRNYSPDEIRIRSTSACAIIADRDVHLVTDEIEFLKNLDLFGQVDVLPDQQADYYNRMITEIQNFCLKPFSILHHAGHSATDANSVTLSLTKSVWLKFSELDSGRLFQIAGNPFVILNSCRTGQVHNRSYGLVKNFLSLGAHGVIATETRVPSSVAYEFTRYFYSQITTTPKTLGEIIEAVRTHFLDNANPLGLTYSLYADADTRIMKLAQ